MPIAEEVRSGSEVEYQSDEEAQTVPQKRKRGRPTKDGLPKVVVKKPVVVRGRGRPRKKVFAGRGQPKKNDKVEDDEIENDTPVEEVDDEEEAQDSDENIPKSKTKTSPAKTPGKGGRGRPKK